MTQYTRPGSGSTTPSDVIQISELAPGSLAGINQIVVGGPIPQVLAYHHTQNTPSNTWVINHNLDFYPNVTVADSGGSLCEGEITYTSPLSLTVRFTSSFSGQAYLS